MIKVYIYPLALKLYGTVKWGRCFTSHCFLIQNLLPQPLLLSKSNHNITNCRNVSPPKGEEVLWQKSCHTFQHGAAGTGAVRVGVDPKGTEPSRTVSSEKEFANMGNSLMTWNSNLTYAPAVNFMLLRWLLNTQPAPRRCQNCYGKKGVMPDVGTLEWIYYERS